MSFGRIIAAAVVPLVLATSACGGGDDSAAADEVEQLGAEAVPAELQGLTVNAEGIAGAKDAKRPFVDALGLYSLRSNDLLQATLQISRFTKEAEATKSRFRQAVVQQVGSTVPKAFRMGDQTVYLTTGRRQSIAVWFKDRHVFILSTREEFSRPRSLLRDALEIEP